MNPIKRLISEGVIFDKNTHQYFYDGVEYLSATSLIRKYTRGFPLHSMAERVANKRGVSRDEVEREWRKNSLEAAKRGTAMHEAIESFIEGGVIEKPFEGLLRSIEKEILSHASFYGFSTFLTECKFVNKAYKYAGTFDFAAFSPHNECVLFDFKTSKIGEQKQGFMLQPVSHLRASKDVLYSLQLYLYKRAIEAFNFHVVSMQIVYIDEHGIVSRNEALPLENEANALLADWVETIDNRKYLFRNLMKQ